MECHATTSVGLLFTLKATEAGYQNAGSGTGLGEMHYKSSLSMEFEEEAGGCWRLYARHYAKIIRNFL